MTVNAVSVPRLEELPGPSRDLQAPRYRALRLDDVERAGLVPPDALAEMRVVAAVLPFRTNTYILGHLIDWSRVPDDPIYQLTFPQRGMLGDGPFHAVADALRSGDRGRLDRVVDEVRHTLNPHPDGQKEKNVPRTGDGEVAGVQHKYRETVLVFPAGGQTCHAYCTFCFRWPQFVGRPDWRFVTDHARGFADYVRGRTEVTDVILTGGDPLVMAADRLETYLAPLLDCPHVRNIRIGTKSLAYWPQRFTTDLDADEVLRLFERVQRAGRHLTLMVHYDHPVELSTPQAQAALARVRTTGAQVRAQSPVVRHVNDDADTLARMWREQVRLGAIPYYLFVPRETGANRHFEVPLDRALSLYEAAYAQVSGLAQTVRGPVMSTELGKVLVDGRLKVAGERCLVLKVVQARDPALVGALALARLDPAATWLSDLSPVVDPAGILGAAGVGPSGLLADLGRADAV